MKDRPKLLDLFCGAGGAAMGYHRAGFDVVGVDIKPQPHFPFEFIQADAMTYPLESFDVIHASPPCQKFTAYQRCKKLKPAVDLIEPTRQKLQDSGVPFIIENVLGTPLKSWLMLCGTMFGLAVRRHRMFETNIPYTLQPLCNHNGIQIPVYGHSLPEWFQKKWAKGYPAATNNKNLRHTVEIGVYRIGVKTQRIAMGIDWMNRNELSQAIPPAYTEYIGKLLMDAL